MAELHPWEAPAAIAKAADRVRELQSLSRDLTLAEECELHNCRTTLAFAWLAEHKEEQ